MSEKCTNRKIGRLLARYELGMLEPEEREAFANHLLQCDFCHAELYAMEPIMDLLRARREAALASKASPSKAEVFMQRMPLVLRERWRAIAWAASILLIVGAGWALIRWLHPPEELPQAPRVASPEASPAPKPAVPSTRDLARLRSPETEAALARAISAYEKGDFIRTIEILEPITRLEPENAEAHFYLGVSWLRLQRPQEAIAPLRQAVLHSVGEEADRSRYYLALAYAQAGQREEALRELEAILAGNSRYRAQAAQMKRKILRSETVRP